MVSNKNNYLENEQNHKSKIDDLLNEMNISDDNIDDILDILVRKYIEFGLVQYASDECGRFVLSKEELDGWD